jgi:hypothetical protein
MWAYIYFSYITTILSFGAAIFAEKTWLIIFKILYKLSAIQQFEFMNIICRLIRFIIAQSYIFLYNTSLTVHWNTFILSKLYEFPLRKLFFSIVDNLRVVAAYDDEILMKFSQRTINVSSLCDNFNPVSFASTSAGL